MKRHPDLRSYSEDHHHGLVASRKLKHAAESGSDDDETVTDFLLAWRREIEPHFRDEEEVLLPALASIAGDEHPLVRRTKDEHETIRGLVEALGGPEVPRRRETALRLATLLHDHIRFEEAELFPEIERRVSLPELDAIAETTARRHRRRGA
jgi:hemerythrin-like domain-containing protein